MSYLTRPIPHNTYHNFFRRRNGGRTVAVIFDEIKNLHQAMGVLEDRLATDVMARPAIRSELQRLHGKSLQLESELAAARKLQSMPLPPHPPPPLPPPLPKVVTMAERKTIGPSAPIAKPWVDPNVVSAADEAAYQRYNESASQALTEKLALQQEQKRIRETLAQQDEHMVAKQKEPEIRAQLEPLEQKIAEMQHQAKLLRDQLPRGTLMFEHLYVNTEKKLVEIQKQLPQVAQQELDNIEQAALLEQKPGWGQTMNSHAKNQMMTKTYLARLYPTLKFQEDDVTGELRKRFPLYMSTLPSRAWAEAEQKLPSAAVSPALIDEFVSGQKTKPPGMSNKEYGLQFMYAHGITDPSQMATLIQAATTSK